MAAANKPESKLQKFIKAPIRVLTKARDFYIKNMNQYADHIAYGSVMGCPTGNVANNLPKNFSVNNSANSSSREDDYKELLRAASARGLSSRDVDINGGLQSQLQQGSRNSVTGRNYNDNMRRSCSVGIGRIDEEKSYDHFDDIKVKTDFLPRSRSYGVSRRTSRSRV